MNLDKIKADALAATPGPWVACDFQNDFGEKKFTVAATFQEVLHPGQSSIWPGGIVHQEVANSEASHLPIQNAAHIANCEPQTILKMIAVIEAAKSVLPQLCDDSARGLRNANTLRIALAALESP